MNLRPFTAILAAAALSVSNLGCSKKDDPTAKSTINTGSYVFNGQLRNCAAVAHTSSASGTDFLYVELTTAPQPVNASEMLRLVFTKSSSQPASAYVLQQLIQAYNGSPTSIYSADSFTLTSSRNGIFSGTFSSMSSYSTIPLSIANGVFTDVQL